MKGVALGILLTVIACSTPGGSTTIAVNQTTEPDRLLADLEAADVEAEQVDAFSSDPLGGEGRLICVRAEEIRVYLFANEEEASAALAGIDRENPSNVGDSIVEWAGNPRFWHRGRILVLYLGEDEETENLLTDVLGEPFARGSGPGRGLPGVPGACGEG